MKLTLTEGKNLKALLGQMDEEAHMNFKYGVNMNLKKLNSALKPIEETEKQAREVLKDYDKAYEEAKNKIIMELGEDDGLGGMRIMPKSKNFKKWVERHNELITELKDKFKKEWETYDKKVEELAPKYEEEFEFIPYKIELSYVPAMSIKVLEVLQITYEIVYKKED